ncbi:hypothetical protein A3D85_00765 [Candidatus Amesbacteria bacterium RIFCSPHIGHO2_02_FULL_47_9]|uniref:Uncharacterized protein n=1 Tax=Candidatus Amesbacteria bacterium RIFCSPHIGHO2_01_FULL_48_32b TaxID=1797253 RepID=A0A1F4YEX8_9BACT|nr:MAG: hypothetical protein A2876_04075 [Candidatus Amesbacteria bacterium RIFCSPHIGHO2_01_FULL_48_32b]OGD02721.1 MAG: hypothetical protein A3D85_00765 [Candidatus Amesbacteria bacterium RIFCSPHIGHO2_02_FULL_47_9]OGD08577.1 MAG: hypothetical protein A2899_02345 [Candidatus Amesbacteria bacterium RIFCSPLOWO2_01_FULL_49_25]
MTENDNVQKAANCAEQGLFLTLVPVGIVEAPAETVLLFAGQVVLHIIRPDMFPEPTFTTFHAAYLFTMTCRNMYVARYLPHLIINKILSHSIFQPPA